METTAHGWQIFDAGMPVLMYQYSFGPSTAQSLAVRTPAGVSVFSPPYRAADGVHADLERYGRVHALVATNAFHHLGLPEWKARYPGAAVYAPQQSIARVQRKTGIKDVMPLAAAAASLQPAVTVLDLPHFRTGEALACLTTSRGLAWYVTDCISNMPSLPAHPIGRLIYGLTGSAPGLKFNNFAAVFMVKDKRALKAWLAARFEADKPRWILPAHGDVVDVEMKGAEAAALFRAG